MGEKRYPIQMEIAGDVAMWTRPDSGDSPISYPAPTYSAARGIIETVAWGPCAKIIPQKVELCRPPVYHSYVTNYGGPLREPAAVQKGNNYQLYATVLIDVCYRIYADVILNPDKSKLPERALLWDKRTTSPAHAYQEIFNRRLRRGQSYRTLCLGWSEFTASYFGPFREETRVCSDLPDIPIPSMLREVFSDGYRSEYRVTYDTNLVIRNGILIYPKREGGVE